MPVYRVQPGNRIIRANTHGQAASHVAKAMFKATPLKPDDVLDLIAQGAKIEDARAPVNQELFAEASLAENIQSPEVCEHVFKYRAPYDVAIAEHDKCGKCGAPRDTPDPLPAIGGPMEPESPHVVIEIPQETMARVDESDLRLAKLLTPADDIDTVTLEGIDYVQ